MLGSKAGSSAFVATGRPSRARSAGSAARRRPRRPCGIAPQRLPMMLATAPQRSPRMPARRRAAVHVDGVAVMADESASSVVIDSPDGATCGYIRACGEEFAVRVGIAGGPSAAATFECCPRLRAVLSDHRCAVRQRLVYAADAKDFISDLSELIEHVLHAAPPARLPSAAFYDVLMSELDAIGSVRPAARARHATAHAVAARRWSALVRISPSLDQLELVALDDAGRAHALTLELPPEYPHAPPRARAVLPAPFELSWGAVEAAGGDYSLAVAMAQFREALGAHQVLWAMLDDIDTHTCVLEPKNPSRDALGRRIALGSHCSLQLTLHAAAPAALPQLHLLGAERLLGPMRRAMNANLGKWDPERSVRINLLDLLDVALPAPRAGGSAGDEAEADEYSVECAICYQYELDGQAPDLVCDGCAKPFHGPCLCEWLRALPSTHQSFNRLFGECPYCDRAITVENVQLLSTATRQ